MSTILDALKPTAEYYAQKVFYGETIPEYTLFPTPAGIQIAIRLPRGGEHRAVLASKQEVTLGTHRRLTGPRLKEAFEAAKKLS